MRPLLLGLFLLCTQCALAQSPLQRKVRLNRPQLSVEQLFAEIESQANLVFSYSNDVPLEQQLIFAKTQANVRYFLNTFAEATPFTYRLSGKKILIFRPGEPVPIATVTPDDDAKYTLSGYLRDASSDEELLYGRIAVLETGGGVVSNDYGFYSLTLPAGEYHVRYSYLGYAPQILTVNLDQDRQKNMYMQSQAVKIKTVEIDEIQAEARLHAGDAGSMDISVAALKSIPVILGEGDILKSLQLMPGISGANEGGSGLYVRGGNVDENLLLFDEAPVYNPGHLLGFFSVFNSDALKDVRIHKGAVPPRFGGRASSVFDIRTREGNRSKVSGSGGIGILASRLAIDGPMFKKKGGFLIAARRSYVDFLLRRGNNSSTKDAKLYFQDLNLKFNYKFSDQDRIYLSGYAGEDVLDASTLPIGLKWGNTTSTFRWNHLFSDKLFSNTSVIVSNYSYEFHAIDDSLRLDVGAKIRNFNLKEDLTWFVNDRNTVRMGMNFMTQEFRPGEYAFATPADTLKDALNSKRTAEISLYAGNEQRIGKKLELKYGLRGTLFGLLGPDSTYVYDDQGKPVDTLYFDRPEVYKLYGNLAPRISAKWQLNEVSSIKGAYTRLFQNIHKLSNSAASLPTDYWTPVSINVKPLRTDQVSLGYFRNLPDQKIEVSVEGFHKWSKNQIDYKDGATLFFNNQFESQLVFGKGRAYGLEFLLRKPKGRLTGWVSYTLSRTERQIAQINQGSWYPARQDRTHDISLVLAYKINEKLLANLNWVYFTGDAVTFPSGKYTVDGNTLNYYTERNGNRYPDYHRLDLGLTWLADTEGNFTQDLNFSIYNVYARKNAFSITFEEDLNQPRQLKAVKVFLFSIVPAITWNFQF